MDDEDDSLHTVSILAEHSVLCVLDCGRVLRLLHCQFTKRGVAAILATERSTTGSAGLYSALAHSSDGRGADGGGGDNGGVDRRGHDADSDRGRVDGLNDSVAADGHGNGSGGDGGGDDEWRRATGAGSRLLTLTLARLELGMFYGVETSHDTDSVSSVLFTLTEQTAGHVGHPMCLRDVALPRPA